jgi:CcmD family protein
MQTPAEISPEKSAAKPLPTETPRTGFGAVEGQASAQDAGPMANFGFTVAAYAVLWVVLTVFLLSTWRKQLALDKRLGTLEDALAKGAGVGQGTSPKS